MSDASTTEKILEAAKKVFLQKGMAGARMQEIADEAGINKALLHYYFRNKDQLFEQIFLEAASHFLPAIIQIMDSERSLFDKIELFCHAYIDQLIKTPFVPIFIINEINRQPQAFLKKVLGNNMPPVQKMLGQIDASMKQGIIQRVEPVDLLLNILSLCIFPFLARPMVQIVASLKDKQFLDLMESRKKEIPEMIIRSISK